MEEPVRCAGGHLDGGNASGSNGARASSDQCMLDLQNRVVGGAVESALRSMSSELAVLSKQRG